MTSISTLLPTYATVNLAALAHNLSLITRYLPTSCEVMAIVKANAYGHGALAVAQALAKQGIGRFAVASLSDLGRVKVQVNEHSNSARLIGDLNQPNVTSYFTMCFVK